MPRVREIKSISQCFNWVELILKKELNLAMSFFLVWKLYIIKKNCGDIRAEESVLGGEVEQPLAQQSVVLLQVLDQVGLLLHHFLQVGALPVAKMKTVSNHWN